MSSEHTDVLVVGAGISGIGAAYHLGQQCPDKSVVVLETQHSFGGTWLTHTYPGIRSDSDLYTFGYRFKPWVGAPIATAGEILTYLGEVIDENDLARHIRYHHTIVTAEWSSDDKLWTIEGTRTDTGDPFAITASFLYMCQGYYRHSQGYTPIWPGMDSYQGTMVHPQTWPDGLDYQGKRVIVIGSGATAATMIPAMAGDVEHITMVQRSPTYFRAARNVNELADLLRELEVDETWVHEIVRRKILFDQAAFTEMCFTHPEEVKAQLLADVRAELAPEHEELVESAFTPSYLPWRQRVAFVPDGDLFQGVNSGKASIITDEIDTFTETGLRMKSGDTVDADIIITATGFNLNVLGDIAFTVDDEPLDFSETVAYRGTMFTGIPNMAWVFGYFRASWTLRADMIADFVCRLLQHMDDTNADMVVPALRPEDEGMKRMPWVDPENFNPGYLQRGMHLLPKQGDREPWRHTQDYWAEKDIMPAADLDDGALVYD